LYHEELWNEELTCEGGWSCQPAFVAHRLFIKDINPFHSDWDGITSLAAVFILDVGLPILPMWSREVGPLVACA
jgi:hypothetical protein